METLTLWAGSGWYGDLGRCDSDGKSYIEAARIATLSEYDESGVDQNYGDEDTHSPYIWNYKTGRGTPYLLMERPEDSIDYEDLSSGYHTI